MSRTTKLAMWSAIGAAGTYTVSLAASQPDSLWAWIVFVGGMLANVAAAVKSVITDPKEATR